MKRIMIVLILAALVLMLSSCGVSSELQDQRRYARRSVPSWVSDEAENWAYQLSDALNDSLTAEERCIYEIGFMQGYNMH